MNALREFVKCSFEAVPDGKPTEADIDHLIEGMRSQLVESPLTDTQVLLANMAAKLLGERVTSDSEVDDALTVRAVKAARKILGEVLRT